MKPMFLRAAYCALTMLFVSIANADEPAAKAEATATAKGGATQQPTAEPTGKEMADRVRQSLWPKADVTFKQTGEGQAQMYYKGKPLTPTVAPQRLPFMRDPRTMNDEEAAAVIAKAEENIVFLEDLLQNVRYGNAQLDLALQENIRLEGFAQEYAARQAKDAGLVEIYAKELRALEREQEDLRKNQERLQAERDKRRK